MEDKINFNCLVNKELQRLSDRMNSQIMPNDDFQTFGFSNNLTENLQQWYWRHNPSADSMNELLQILNDEGLGVPICVDGFGSDSRTKTDQFDTEIKKEKPKSTNSTIVQIQDQQKQMNAKLKLLIHEIAIAKVRIDVSEEVTDDVNNRVDMFPIETADDLIAFDKSIDDRNISSHVTNLKRLIKNEDINKSLTRIIDINLLVEHNLNGTNNKLALNSYPKFLKVLHRAYDSFSSYSEFTLHLKEAMKRAKNRHNKSNWQHRQKSHSDWKKSKSDAADDGIVYNEEDLPYFVL